MAALPNAAGIRRFCAAPSTTLGLTGRRRCRRESARMRAERRRGVARTGLLVVLLSAAVGVTSLSSRGLRARIHGAGCGAGRVVRISDGEPDIDPMAEYREAERQSR